MNYSVLYSQEDIENLRNSINQLQEMQKDNVKKIEVLQTSRILDFAAKYNLISYNLRWYSSYIQVLEKDIETLRSHQIAATIGTLIAQLNSISEDITGINFNKKIIEILKNNMKETEEKDEGIFSNIIKTVESVISSPLLTQVPFLGGPIGVVNSAITLIKGAGLVDDDIQQTEIKNVESELTKYLIYYDKLFNVEVGYNLDIEYNKAQLLNYENNIIELTKSLNNNINGTDKISEIEIQNKFNIDINQNNNSTIENFLNENEKLKLANNGLEELMSKQVIFETIYQDFLSINKKRIDQIIDALNYAKKENLGDNSKLDQKINKLKNENEVFVISLNKSINIETLRNKKNLVNYNSKVF